VGPGLAESTPGPLILVTEFVGFLTAFRNPGGLDPVLAAVLGATVTVWATFAPCFLWIFFGAPFNEHLRGNILLGSVLSAITAAVVGVVLNLVVWLGLHTLFGMVTEITVLGMVIPVPHLTRLDVFAFLLAAVMFIGMWRLRWGIIPIVLVSAVLGVFYRIVLQRWM